MSEFGSVIDSIYGQFLLRDLFAKMVPGSVVAMAMLPMFQIDPGSFNDISAIGWPIILLAAGGVWTLGFAVQGVGEAIKLIAHYPKTKGKNSRRDLRDPQTRYALRQDFIKLSNAFEQRRAERYAVVKEACGNFATAILIATLLLVAENFSSVLEQRLSPPQGIQLGILIVLWWALIRTNRSHAKKHYEFMEIVVDKETVMHSFDDQSEPSDD